MWTRKRLLERAQRRDLKIEEDDIVPIACLFEPREIQINWEKKELAIPNYGVMFDWDDVPS